jgi:hypothetical protein
MGKEVQGAKGGHEEVTRIYQMLWDDNDAMNFSIKLKKRQ